MGVELSGCRPRHNSCSDIRRASRKSWRGADYIARTKRVGACRWSVFRVGYRLAGGRHRQGDRGAAEIAGRRSARSHAGIDRHPAQRRGQGQPVFPARLQPRSRHRHRYHTRRHAGQHAHPCAWPGLCRSQFHDPRTDQHLELQQGPLFPGAWGFRHRRGSADQLRRYLAPRSRPGDRRHLGLLPRARRDVASGRRRQPARRGGVCARRRAVDDPGQLQQGQPGSALQPR